MKHGLYARDNSGWRRGHAAALRQWLNTKEAMGKAGVPLRLVNWNHGHPVIRIPAPTIKRQS
jgi:hypothetical protein